MPQRVWGIGLAALIAAAVYAGADERSSPAGFPRPVNTEPESEAGWLSADEAARRFRVPEGFRVQVFAAEPDVQNPLAMAWDGRGRLWIAENYTYADRNTKFDLSLRDRVLIFEDRDGDGRFDRRTVFTDDVQMLSSVEVGLGGVWLMAPPRLLFVPDRNGDDVPDGEPQVVLDGFHPTTDNYHTFANGLRWGPDGWLYGRCGASSPGRVGVPGTPDEHRVPLFGGVWRFDPQRKTFEVLCHGTTNPWGLDWNEHGEAFFVNTVNGHLWHVIAGAHYQRPHSVDPNPHVFSLIDTHADHSHWDTGHGKAWSDSRKGDPETDRLGGGHAHCGAMIYLGDNWPDSYRGKLLTLNLHGRRANVERLERGGSGYIGRHEPDILFSADPWFRGLELGYGPDGGVFVLDWSDTGECHEHTGVHRTSGRIFKVLHDGGSRGEPPRRAPPDLTGLSSEALADLHTHRNEWFARQARRALIDRAAARALNEPETADSLDAARAKLLRLFERDPDVVVKLRALQTLFALGGATQPFLLERLDDPDERVRAAAVRLVTDAWPLDTIFGEPHPFAAAPEERVVSRLVKSAREDDSPGVRLALASALQRVPVERRFELAVPLAARAEDAGDHNLPLMVWYGVMPAVAASPREGAELAATCQFPITRRLIARRLGERIDADPAAVSDLLRGVVAERTLAEALDGLSQGLAGRRKVAAPEGWENIRARTVESADAALRDRVRDLSVLFGDGRALDEVKRVALDKEADLAARRAALETLIDARPDDLRAVCEQLLPVRSLNTVAVKGLAQFDDAALGEKLAKSYRSFYPAERPAVIETLASRPAFAKALLEQIRAGRIAPGDVSAFQARQIRSFGDTELNAALAAAWGELRDSPADKRSLIERLRAQLTPEALAAADRGRGRAVFNTACANCHRLHGHGGEIGPDLTGSGRHNLDYVIENLADPSAVVGSSYRVSIVALADGRVLTGTIVSKTAQALTLQTAKERLIVAPSEVDEVRPSPLSLMPDGLLQPLSAQQICDLVAYVMHPTQVALPPDVATGE